MKKNTFYYQDFPVEDYEHDYIGFEEQVNMLKEGIENNARVIGLISENGSGKSTIIKLLKKELAKPKEHTKEPKEETEKSDRVTKVELIKVNLLDPDGENTQFEEHKRMLYQIAKKRLKNNKLKWAYIQKKLNPNFKSLKIATTKKSSAYLFFIAVFFFLLTFLYNNHLLKYFNFLRDTPWEFLVPAIKDFCNISGLLGLLIIFYIILTDELIFNYSKNCEDSKLNENDLKEIFDDLTIEDKTVIVVEDLDRLKDSSRIKQFLEEIYSYYGDYQNLTFIVAITKEQFVEIADADFIDTKFKPFTSVMNLPTIRNDDFDLITRNLLIEKTSMFKKEFLIDIQKDYGIWLWLTRGDNLNIRKIKHRLNEVIHLFLTLKSRLGVSNVSVKSCIAVTYLKNMYDSDFELLIKENKNNDSYTFKLKEIIEYFLKNSTLDGASEITDNNKDLKKDLTDLISNGYLDYNCEMYCYNYAKGNKVFDSYENTIYNSYLFDRHYNLDEEKIQNVLKNDESCLVKAIETREKMQLQYPENIFEKITIFNEVFNYVEESNKKKILVEMLKISPMHINETEERLKKIISSKYFTQEYKAEYIKLVKDDFRAQTETSIIPQIRIKLIKIFIDNILLLIPLYDSLFPLISKEEMNFITKFSDMALLVNKSLIDEKNIVYIVETIDRIFNDKDNNQLYDFLLEIPNQIDYFSKKSKILRLFSVDSKKEFYEKNHSFINLTLLEDIIEFTLNIDYSFETLEKEVISLFNNKKIDEKQLSGYVNILPNISDTMLEFLCSDDYMTTINDKWVELMLKKEMYYGYVKFKTLKDGKAPISKNKKITNQYELLYGNSKGSFDEYLINDENILTYFRIKKVYEKYDKSYLNVMAYAKQDYNLLEYAFNKINDKKGLNEYVINIPEIICTNEEIADFIDRNKDKILWLDKKEKSNFIKCIKEKRLKRKIYNLNNYKKRKK